MRGSIVITNARLIMNHEVIHGSVSVVNGRIDSIDSGLSTTPGAIDLEGDFLMPGMIEIIWINDNLCDFGSLIC
jgi:alpha-D-ribose 1-methylphosphonate 5-triphosphate diphosphatase